MMCLLPRGLVSSPVLTGRLVLICSSHCTGTGERTSRRGETKSRTFTLQSNLPDLWPKHLGLSISQVVSLERWYWSQNRDGLQRGKIEECSHVRHRSPTSAHHQLA